MPPHQQRVIDEKEELLEKYTKLGTFLHNSIFNSLPLKEQDRLIIQHYIMEQYLKILLERINNF